MELSSTPEVALPYVSQLHVCSWGKPHSNIGPLQELMSLSPTNCGVCEVSEWRIFPRLHYRQANYLRTAMPSMGHLVHMPSHIDVGVNFSEEAPGAYLTCVAVSCACVLGVCACSHVRHEVTRVLPRL
jgi:hypothetical protein